VPVIPQFLAKFPAASPSGVTEADVLSMVRDVDTAYVHYDRLLAMQSSSAAPATSPSTATSSSVFGAPAYPTTPRAASAASSTPANTNSGPTCRTVPAAVGAELHTLGLPPVYNTHTHSVDTLAAAIAAPLQFKAHPKSYTFTLRQAVLPRASATGELQDVIYGLCIPTYDVVRVCAGADADEECEWPQVCCCIVEQRDEDDDESDSIEDPVTASSAAIVSPVKPTTESTESTESSASAVTTVSAPATGDAGDKPISTSDTLTMDLTQWRQRRRRI